MPPIRKDDRWWQKAATQQFPNENISSQEGYESALANIFKGVQKRTVPASETWTIDGNLHSRTVGWEPDFYKLHGGASTGKYYTPMGERAEAFETYGKGGYPGSGWSNLYGYDVPSGEPYKFFKKALDDAYVQTGIDPRDITMGQPVTLDFLDKAVRENVNTGDITVQSGGYERDPRQLERIGNQETNPMWQSAWDAKGNPAEGLMRMMDPNEDISMYTYSDRKSIKSMMKDPGVIAGHELMAHMLGYNIMSLGAEGNIHHGSSLPTPSGFRSDSSGIQDYIQLMKGIKGKTAQQDALYNMSYYNPQSELANPYRGFVANAMSKILTDSGVAQHLAGRTNRPYYKRNMNELMARALQEHWSQKSGNQPNFQFDKGTIEAIEGWLENLPPMRGQESAYLRTI